MMMMRGTGAAAAGTAASHRSVWAAALKRLQRVGLDGGGRRGLLPYALLCGAVTLALLWTTVVAPWWWWQQGGSSWAAPSVVSPAAAAAAAAAASFRDVLKRAALAPPSTVTPPLASAPRCTLVTTTDGRALCAPYFFVLGAFKAGTTSLYAYLSQHPEVRFRAPTDRDGDDDDAEGDEEGGEAAANPHDGVRHAHNAVRLKETNFFTRFNRTDTLPHGEPSVSAIAGGGAAAGDGRQRGGGGVGGGEPFRHATGAEYALAALSGRNLTHELALARAATPTTLADYVRAFFPALTPTDNLVTGEASPSYLFDPTVPAKLRATFPHARLVALVRDPVERAYSRWNHLVGLRCVAEPDPRLCSPDGIGAVFDHVVDLQLPQLRGCLAEADLLLPPPLSSSGSGAVPPPPLPAYDARAYDRVVTCMRAHNARSAAAVIRDLDAATLGLLHDTAALTHAVQRALFVRSALELDVLTHSLYLPQVRQWHAHFPREQLLVVVSEDLFRDGVATMARVAAHLRLNATATTASGAIFDWAPVVARKYNVGIPTQGSGAAGAGAANATRARAGFVASDADATTAPTHTNTNTNAPKPKQKTHPISAHTRQALSDFFAPYNDQLAAYLGLPASPWPRH